jgi:predicted AAA+ superfamily ATPase
MEKLYNSFKIKLGDVSTDYVRDIHNQIEWEARMVAILGARGVGKSTLVLQHIKLHEELSTTLYVSADDIWFTTHTLVELADSFYKLGGKTLYIDEVHKYKNWSTELKNIYDTYAKLRIVYTGSSILDIQKGGADLSRRKLEYKMHGLSFREYLGIKYGWEIATYSLEEILSHKINVEIPEFRPVALFKDYLKEGYYPYFMEKGYAIRLKSVINRILEEDIPQFAELSVTSITKLKKLLYIIAQSVPFKPNYSKIGRDLDLYRTTVSDLFQLLDKAELINLLEDETQGISSLAKVDKVYLNNPNISYALSENEPEIGNVRETIFFALTSVLYNVYSSKVSDFKINEYTFEVGGKNKKQKQIQGIKNAFVVKDDIESGYLNVIPLWEFGLLY